MNPLNPTKFYADLKSEYPELVAQQDSGGDLQAERIKRTRDMVTATREAAGLRSADVQSPHGYGRSSAWT